MIKRTMQEWADFFDCYIAKNGENTEYRYERGNIWYFENKPHLKKGCDTWVADEGSCHVLWVADEENCRVLADDYYCYGGTFGLMDLQELMDHDWRVLVEPKGVENERKN